MAGEQDNTETDVTPDSESVDETLNTGENSDAVGDVATPDDKTGGDTGDVGAEGSDAVPDTYADFVMPEGISVDETALTEAVPIFKELGLTQAQAQKLVDIEAKRVQASSEKSIEAFTQQKSEWRKQAENDKEFGGDKFEENVKVAQSAMNRFGTPELKQVLEEYGIGNHPEFVRLMVKVGKLTAEDVPGNITTPMQDKQDIVSRLYPTDVK